MNEPTKTINIQNILQDTRDHLQSKLQKILIAEKEPMHHAPSVHSRQSHILIHNPTIKG